MDFNTCLERWFKFKYRPARHSMPIVVASRLPKRTGQHKSQTSGRRGLAAMIRDMDYRVGVEIGTYLGESAALWCSVAKKLKLTCIDPYRVYNARIYAETQEEIYQTACKNLESYNATIMRLPSEEAAAKFENDSLDFLHIDGDHGFDACVMDLILWVPKVRIGGLILVHDYTILQGPGVIRAVDSYTHCHSIFPWYATMDYAPTVFWESQRNTE